MYLWFDIVSFIILCSKLTQNVLVLAGYGLLNAV